MTITSPHPLAAPPRQKPWLKWLGIVPFAVFALMFLILPTLYIVIGAFQTESGAFTLRNIADLNTDLIRRAYLLSIKISLASALIGCVVGFAISAAVVFGGLPKWIRSPVITFSGVASNFAGVPLAFAFIATLGPVGVITFMLRDYGINLRALGFNLLTYYGLVIGVLIVVPTAYWVRLRLPAVRPYIEFITLLPLVIPPIVIVFGYIRLYNTSSILPLTGSWIGTNGRKDGRETVFDGRITDVHFLGATIRIQVDIGGTLVSLDTFNTPDNPPPRIGAAVEISVAERDLLVLAE